jgi:hypothetical protein
MTRYHAVVLFDERSDGLHAWFATIKEACEWIAHYAPFWRGTITKEKVN